MTRSVPTTADEFIEQQLDDRLMALENAFDSDALCMVGQIVGGLDDLIRLVVERLRQRNTGRSRLSVLLTTNGGLLEPVQRIVETFRHHYEHVNFLIPSGSLALKIAIPSCCVLPMKRECSTRP